MRYSVCLVSTGLRYSVCLESAGIRTVYAWKVPVCGTAYICLGSAGMRYIVYAW